MPAPLGLIAVDSGADARESRVALELLDELSVALARTFRLSCHVFTQRHDAAYAFEPTRRQYYSTLVLKALGVAGLDATRVLAVTELDLFVPILTFVFGEAQVGGSTALVSLHRLRDEFYGLPPNPAALKARLAKEAVHELGHTFGLRHCQEWRCVMASTHAVERLDVKGAEFCPRCRAAIPGLA